MNEQHTYAGHTLAEIKAAAEVATPGIWVAEPNAINGIECHCVGVADTATCVASTGEICDARYGHQSTLDADYIATANPATVLAMAARIEELERSIGSGIMVIHETPIHVDLESSAARSAAKAYKALHAAGVPVCDEDRSLMTPAKGIALLAKQRDAARLEGWQAARDMAAKACDEHAADRWNLYKGRPPYSGSEDGRAHLQTQGENIGAEFCAASIRAMQPPAEWSASTSADQQAVQCPSAPWPHPDGFAGGLTERRIDDGESEESKKAT